VKRSYSEGLKVADYWANVAGGRKGIVQKVQSVRDPGYLSKLMINSTMNQVVDTDDCGTDRGVRLSVTEPDIIGRYTAAETKVGRTKIPANTLIDTEVLDRMKNARLGKVVVRSPMRCNHHNGLCSKCYGLNEDGNLHDKGTNIGVLAAQALGEPGTQMAMKAFHSGGVYEGKSETSIAGAGLDRAKTMLNMPKVVKGSAVLSTSTGRVTSIRKDPAGGYNVTVGSQQHYVPHNRQLMPKMRAGSRVRKGDPLSVGPVNPHDMLPLTGINRVQGQLASELHGIYGKQGIRRRNSEVVVRALSNITKVEDPGDNPDLVKGDYAPTTTVQHWNNKQKGKKPVMHQPVMRGVKQVPLDMQEDWLARLNHEKLKETIIEGSQRGWSSDIHGTHPIPPLIYSAEFGKKKPY
jgi:DNA-directed RNA polymerase subunit beta'